jgi:hypothetical protein
MTNQEAILQLTSLKGQLQNQVEALGIALDLLTNGYTTDQAAIDAANRERDAALAQLAEVELT